MEPMGSDLEERWSQLLDGMVDDAGLREELLTVAATELNRVVAERRGDCSGLLDAIGSVVDAAPVNDQMWEEANKAFELALGLHPARLVNWLVLDSSYAHRLSAVRPLLEPAAAVFLTDLLVRYGERLERASYLFVTHSEHDWRLINREITMDRATGRITVRLKILKYNGETVLIEGRPDSILTLADAMLTAVNSVADRGAFLQDLAPFMETVEQTLAMFAADGSGPDGGESFAGRARVPGPGGSIPGTSAPTPYR
ncbi:MAG TPA: hypothetical protein VFE14_11315 [Micromonosporaceae bacterium]|jgi:hypothetical protein|nr:hypothetical protein [Micromonosporaceae bacterium]